MSIQVYDVETRQYWEPVVPDAEKYCLYYAMYDDRARIQWSPDDKKFAFLLGLQESNCFGDERVIAIFDGETQSLMVTEEMFRLRYDRLLWSPDSQSIAFINNIASPEPAWRNPVGALTLLDIKTSGTIVLDEDVSNILAWLPESETR